MNLRLKSSYILIFITSFFILGSYLVASEHSGNRVRYQTFFGNCPAKSVGKLTLGLVREFEQKKSLIDLKKIINEKKIEKRYFFSSYKVSYNFLKKSLRFEYECPVPLIKVSFISSKDRPIAHDEHQAILVAGGELYDPTYEFLLKNENKLNRNLPFLGIRYDQASHRFFNKILKLYHSFPLKKLKYLSELYVDKSGELTMMLSVQGMAILIYFGEHEWEEKVGKMLKALDYLVQQGKVPKIINLRNKEKLVVKFSSKQ